jgi:Flp pilus assembly protein TadD/tRNA A-37 threonylcarbamoyl transferase component Bud32
MDEVAMLDRVLPLLQAVHLDQVCDRFESAWKEAGPEGKPPRIEEFLADTPDAERSLLLHHLVLLEIDYRRLRGESPGADEYRPRFPALSARFLAEAFPEVVLPPFEGGTTVAPPPFEPQFRSDRYIVQQFHARGGIGEIWVAEDVEIGRQVALKRLRNQRDGQQDRFLMEAQITGQLEHPGIVPVHDLGVDGEGRPFYVMAFIHGRTLKQVIDEYHAGRLPPGEPREVQRCRLLEVFVKVCEAIAYAHHRGVIHRDLKPDNVMIGPYGETLVLDWGLAKVCSQPETPGKSPPLHLSYATDSTKTQEGLILGSPFYMPPEVASGRAAEADERTDVYLLGATLYHILTGSTPREGRSFQEVIELARNVPPPSPRKLKADVPRALDAICLKAMAANKEDRYAGALEVAADVQRYLAGAPVTAYPEPVWMRTWRWCKRHRRVLGWSLAAVAVLALALFGVIRVRQVLQEEAALRQAAQERGETLQREAETLRRQEQARRNLLEFQRLADERQFYTVSITPAGERPLLHDTRRGQEAGEKALALGNKLARELEELPLPAERALLRKQLHDLLLLMVQAQSEQAPDAQNARDMLRRLEQASALRKPSRGYHRLRAHCYQLLGDTGQQQRETRQAEDPKLPATALDHFLLAEQARAGAAGQADPTNWQANPARLSTAVEHYQAALRLEPDNYWCHFHLGRCYLSLGKGSEAVEALGTCVALRPRSPWGFSARGLTLGLIGRYAEGEKDLNTALALEPGFRPALLSRGTLAWLQGKLDQALADFKAVLQPPADKRLIEAAYYRGLLHAERRKYREARTDLDAVIREAPGFRFAYLSRAQLYFLQDDPRGLADLTTFLELGLPERSRGEGRILCALRGRLLRHLVPKWGLTKPQTTAALRLALEQLNRAMELRDSSAEVLQDKGMVLEGLGKPVEALVAYDQALKAAPPRDLEAKIQSKRGWILAQIPGRPQQEKAREAFHALLRLEPQSADARAGLGYLAALGKSPTEAQREALHGLLNGSGDYLALHNLACIYAELSQSDKAQAKQHQDVAMALLRRAVELWRRGGRGPNELDLIRRDSSFDSLREREDYKKLFEK